MIFSPSKRKLWVTPASIHRRLVVFVRILANLETVQNDKQFDNIVPLLMLHKGMGVQEAADYTVALIAESYKEINEAEKRLPKLEGRAKDHLAHYVEQCKDQATGSVLFQ